MAIHYNNYLLVFRSLWVMKDFKIDLPLINYYLLILVLVNLVLNAASFFKFVFLCWIKYFFHCRNWFFFLLQHQFKMMLYLQFHWKWSLTFLLMWVYNNWFLKIDKCNITIKWKGSTCYVNSYNFDSCAFYWFVYIVNDHLFFLPL